MNKRDQAPEKEQQLPFDKAQQNNSRVAMRTLVMFYIAYLAYKVFRGYLENGDPFLLIAAVVFLVADAVIAVISLRQWKRGQEEIAMLSKALAEESPDMDTDEDPL